jgi:primosomal protein N'
MIYKPVPSPIDKIQNTYRWRIVIKGRLNKRALSTINNVVKPFYNGKNKDVNIIVDSNPNNML